MHVVRYGKIFVQMTSANLKGLMAFKIDFLVSFFGGLLSQTIGLLFIGVLFQNIPEVVGWNVYEVALLYGYMLVAEGILTLSFQGTNNIAKLVRTGMFDCFLTRPLPLSLQIYGLQTNLAGLGTGLTGLVVIGYSLWQLRISLTAHFVMLFVTSLWLGAVIRININFATSSMAFWTQGAIGVKSFIYKMQDLAKYPIGIYPKAFQIILLTAIPFAAISYVPAAVLLGKEEVRYFLILPAAAGFTVLVRMWIFGRALQKYEGAGN